jgi:phosphorylase/glycogen(starch) synthase
MNGVMHFSVLDGWWVEGYRPGAGWALPQERTYDDQYYQNELDSATIYNIIENDIVPAYYKTGGHGLSKEWVGYIKNTIAHVASNFTTNRMLTDYVNQYYDPQYARSQSIKANDYALARSLAAWKQQMRENWDSIKVVSYTQPAASYSLEPGRDLTSEVVLDLGNIKPEDIGVEMLFTAYDAKGKLRIREICEFQLDEYNEGIAKYSASIFPERTGMYQVATRVYPKNALLPHKQDLPLVKWL